MDAVEQLLTAHSIVRSDPAAAESLCQDVLQAERENPFALHLLGILALRRGQPSNAATWLTRAVNARPNGLESRIALAEALARDQQDQPAADMLRAILVDQPRNAPVLVALSMVLLRLDEAPGALLAALRRLPEARRTLEAAVALAPTHAQARLNLGNTLLDLDRENAAECCIRAALALDPDAPEAWASLGFLLAGADRLEEAIAACDRAIALRPEFAQAYWNRSFARLRGGDFPRGWIDYEWRRRHPRFASISHVLPGPQWEGGDLRGRRLLVNAAQGLGDTIQLARYLPVLIGLGAAVTLVTVPSLFDLLGQFPVRLVARGTDLPPYDVWVDQMSLPRVLGTTPDTIPGSGGYLRVEPAARRAGGVQVGLVCAGNPHHSNDFRRSLPPEALAPLRAVPGVAFTNLQVGPTSTRLAEVFGIPDRSAGLHPLAATARIVAGLDLVISADTAVAHLAGALGRPVWIMVPRAPDWRWLAGRDDSPWYRSARLFRQDTAGDWQPVVARVAQALAAKVALAPTAS
jgi:tetratricopeptide (TPR) repeat protein